MSTILRLTEMCEQFIEMSKSQKKKETQVVVSLEIMNELHLNLNIGLLAESTSKCTKATVYSELNGKIERMSKLLHFALIKLSFTSTILSPLITTFSNYFINHLGSDSYQDLILV